MTHQYDQWGQAFKLTDSNGTTISPSMVTSIKVLINDAEYVYAGASTDTLIYKSSDQKWYALLTQEQTSDTRSMNIQFEINFGNDTVFTTKSRILHSDVTKVRLSPSMDWSEDE